MVWEEEQCYNNFLGEIIGKMVCLWVEDTEMLVLGSTLPGGSTWLQCSIPVPLLFPGKELPISLQCLMGADIIMPCQQQLSCKFLEYMIKWYCHHYDFAGQLLLVAGGIKHWRTCCWWMNVYRMMMPQDLVDGHLKILNSKLAERNSSPWWYPGVS